MTQTGFELGVGMLDDDVNNTSRQAYVRLLLLTVRSEEHSEQHCSHYKI